MIQIHQSFLQAQSSLFPRFWHSWKRVRGQEEDVYDQICCAGKHTCWKSLVPDDGGCSGREIHGVRRGENAELRDVFIVLLDVVHEMGLHYNCHGQLDQHKISIVSAHNGPVFITVVSFPL